ncbi:ATP-binding protein [Cupriavidus necator]|nr:ATP-binding protein [Cupriavidus necator]MDX6007635.1 ATP-binding protein [Cupriavidus necator]
MQTINPQLFSHGQTLRVGGVTLRATDGLRTHREKLARIVLDQMYQFVGLLDADGLTLEINEAALAGAGIRLDDIQGKPFWEARWWCVSKQTQECAQDAIERACRGEFVRFDVEVYGRTGGEETIIVDFSLLPVKDRRNEVMFLLAEARNITEKKRSEAEIVRKNEELQQLLDKIRQIDALKSDFFAKVSHELRTPLALILGPAESLIAGSDNLNEQQRRDLTVIRRNATTLLKHVNDLLDLAKLDAGKISLDYARIDVAHTVRAVAAHFDTLAPQRSYSYVVALPEACEAEVDPQKFERIVLNLLSNAFKFTPPGGRIRCGLEPSGNSRFLVTVQDSGPGVAPEMRTVLFEPFCQGRAGMAGEFGGTGLGLAIVKEFVDLHGGTVSMSEAPGGGALFQVELPLLAPKGTYVRQDVALPQRVVPAVNVDVNEALLATELPYADSRQALDRPRVLVVEDNVEMGRFLSQILADEYRVEHAMDGSKALAAAIAEPPDLVVTDLMMPELSGDELVAEMRKQASLAQVPVLVLSARADDALRLELLASSVQDYVIKPFSVHELRVRVRNLIRMKSARDVLQKELASQNDDLGQLARQLIASRQELQRSLAAERASEQRWRVVFENSAVGIALTDTDGQFMAANPAFRRMLGYTEKELTRLSIESITPAEDRAIARLHIANLVGGKRREYRLEKRYSRKDGSAVWVDTSVSLIPGDGSRQSMLVGIVEDITERKRAEHALAQTEAELARVSRVTTMGELAASIAHEVNQPLAGVVANGHACLRWLAASPPNEQEAHEAVQRIIRDANRAGNVIARIRQFLKREEPQRTAIRPNEVVSEVISMVQDSLRSNRISLCEALAPNLPPVAADRVQLQQVILNLVMNAIEAMSLVEGRARVLMVTTQRNDQSAVHVAIRDTGVGLDTRQLERVFDAFYTTKPQGMGMGLAICRSIVETHGGQLWAMPNDGFGASFHFTFPIAASDGS